MERKIRELRVRTRLTASRTRRDLSLIQRLTWRMIACH